MKIGIDEELMELIPQFLINRERDFLYLRDLLFQRRYSEAKDISHSIKGVLGSYGFEEAGRMAAEIDDLLRQGKYQGLRERVVDLERYFSEMEIEYIQED